MTDLLAIDILARALTPRTEWPDRHLVDAYRDVGRLRLYIYGAGTDYLEIVAPGGFDLVRRYGNDVALLNLDRSALSNDSSLDRYRAQIIRAAEVAGVAIIPVGFTALWASLRDTPHSRPRRDMRLVHRRGLEAVYRIGNDYYLSGYDDQEKPPLYFLCALPHPVSSIDEAREALKPESVKIAEAAGISVKRQGDLFFIKSRMKRRRLLAEGRWRSTGGIYGTAHTASKMVDLPNGMTLVKGTVRHRPSIIGERRRPDHHDLRLGFGYWYVAKNTVPIAGSTRRPQGW